MKKTKRILAAVGAAVLVGLYLATLLCALFAKEHFMDLMMASAYATAVIPVLLWVCLFFWKRHSDDSESDPNEKI